MSSVQPPRRAALGPVIRTPPPARRTGGTDARAQDGHYVTCWTSEQVLAVKRNSSNTIPPIKAEDYPATFPDHYGCEDWTLATRDNRAAEIDGQPIIMSLAAPRDVAPGERHFSARLRQETNGLTTASSPAKGR